MIPLSVLDIAQVSAGSTVGDALRATTELARRTEELGYGRFWLAEHHIRGYVCCSPPVLVAHVAAATSTIRVGSGGVMLPNHQPLVVAEQFGLLDALHPGRIDLGIGRAPGADPVVARALRRGQRPPSDGELTEELDEVLAYLNGEGPVPATAAQDARPEVWLLGSGMESARLAGRRGLPFGFAHHFSPEALEPALNAYRSSFVPSATLDRPRVLLAVSALCADDDGQARRLALPGALAFLQLRRGRPGPLPSPEEARTYPYTAADRGFVVERFDAQVIGSPQSVRAQVESLLERSGADELMVVTGTHDPADRLRSYELLAEALAPAAV